MTKKDKEKALEIANKQKKYYGNPQYEMRDENWSVHECYKSAMQAMQWKEQQMTDKACEWLNNNTVTSDNGSVIYTASSHNIDKKTFIEQFKKAMGE